MPGHGGEVRDGLHGADGGDEHDAESPDGKDEDGQGLHGDGRLAPRAVQLQVRREAGRQADAADAQLGGGEGGSPRLLNKDKRLCYEAKYSVFHPIVGRVLR